MLIQLYKRPESQSFEYCVALFEETRTWMNEAFILKPQLNDKKGLKHFQRSSCTKAHFHPTGEGFFHHSTRMDKKRVKRKTLTCRSGYSKKINQPHHF
jgi:hypothetical protein